MVEATVHADPSAPVQCRVSGKLVNVPPGETRTVTVNGAQLGQLRAYCEAQRELHDREECRVTTPNDEADEDGGADPSETEEDPLLALPGVGPSKADGLRDHGFDTLDAVQQADVSDLTDVSGIGPSKAGDILDHFDQPTEEDAE